MPIPNEMLTYPSMLCTHHLLEPAREEAIITSISQMASVRQSEAETAHLSCCSQSLVELAIQLQDPKEKERQDYFLQPTFCKDPAQNVWSQVTPVQTPSSKEHDKIPDS